MSAPRLPPALAVRPCERRQIPLSSITGPSPNNCRPDLEADDVTELAENIAAQGLIHALLVSAVPGPLARFWIDAGGRRYKALCRLRDAGRLAADALIECDVQSVDEGTAREVSLAENVLRRDLHPVDQCAAFEAMIAAGQTPETIAAHFAITLRQVRQRLSLSKLSPRVRALWRDGTLTTEVAQAFTYGNHAAQDALLDSVRNRSWLLRQAVEVRNLLTVDAIDGSAPEALYVGADAYLAAGGRLDENLFADHPLFCDGELLRRLAREKLMRDGETVLAETGYGFCYPVDEIEQPWHWDRSGWSHTDAEVTRLQQIGEALDASESEDEIRQLEDEQAAIEARAIDRGCPQADRASRGIFVDVSEDGYFVVTDRAVARPPEAAAPHASVAADAPGASSATSGAAAPKKQKPADPIEAAADSLGVMRDVLSRAIAAAVVRIIAQRPDLALVVMVARWGGSYSPDEFEPTMSGVDMFGPPSDDLLGRLRQKGFPHAVRVCGEASTADLTAAFATIVAGAIRLQKRAPVGAWTPLMEAFARRGADLRGAFRATLDYTAYFEAASRLACRTALESMQIVGIEKNANKAVLGSMAADAAKKADWLPFPLSAWAEVSASAQPQPPEPVRDASPPLAAAMAQAIDVDEDRRAALETFLEEHTTRAEGDEVRTKSSDLYELYVAQVAEPLPLTRFGAALADIGIAKKRFATGVYYLGLRIVEVAASEAA